MSAIEILAELPHLTTAELEQVHAKLRELIDPNHVIHPPVRIRSPRLAHPAQSKELLKQVVEIRPDAKL